MKHPQSWVSDPCIQKSLIILCQKNTNRIVCAMVSMHHLHVVAVLLIGLASTRSLALPAGHGESRQGRLRGGPVSTMPHDYKSICGVTGVRPSRKLSASLKILNGTCAPYGSLPWTAQIQMKNAKDQYKHHCGGTILTEDIILTAAHCFQNIHHSYMRVVVGQGNLDVVDEAEMVFDIESAILHPDWDSPDHGRYSNDMAILKLRRKGSSGIQFSDAVAPACMPMADTPMKSDTECILSGWGKIDTSLSIADDACMMSATVPIIPDEKCRSLYEQHNRSISPGMMCAGYEDGSVDSCNGDSGGPLACKVNGRFHVMGVVSWGEGCGQASKPGVYSKVKHYLHWIQSTIAAL